MDDLAQAAQRFLRLATRLRRVGAHPTDREIPVSPAQVALMEVIASSPGCSVQEMAEALQLTPPTVSIAVRQLERLGWVERRPHPTDRRALQIFLTEEGEEVYRRAMAFQRRKFENLLRGLTPSRARDVVGFVGTGCSGSRAI